MRPRPLVGVVLATLLVTVTLSPAATARSTAPTTSPEPSPWRTQELSRLGVAQDEAFLLTIGTTRVRYEVDEPIDITTLVRYVGTSDGVEVGTAYGGLVAFEVEQLDGPVHLEPIRLASCGPWALAAGETRSIPFRKSGVVDPDDPMADTIRALILDPELRLPMGTWRLTAWAEYGAPDCRG